MKTINYYKSAALSKAIYACFLAFIMLSLSCSKDSESGGYFELKDGLSKIEASAQGTSQTFTIKSGGDWKIEPLSKERWLKIEPTEGHGDGTVTVTVNRNYTQEARATTLFFTVDGQLRNQVLKIEQDASTGGTEETDSYLNIEGNPTGLTVPEEGINKQYVLRTTGNWRIEITDGEDWLNVSPMEGKYDAGFAVSAGVNAAVTPRTAKLIFYLDDVRVPGEFMVNQEGMELILQEDFNWLNYGSAIFNATTGEKAIGSWTADEKAKEWTGTIPPAEVFPTGSVGTSSSTYARVGFVKLGKTSYGGDLVSPKLSAIQGTKNLQVSFKAVRYATGDHYLLKIGVIGPGTASVSSFNVTNVANPNSTLAGCTAAWQAPEAKYSFTITGATADTQIQFLAGDWWIGTGSGWPSATNRIFIDDILVSVKK